MKKLALTSSLLFALPLIALAQVPGNNLQSLIIWLGDTLNLLIPVLIALALVAFFWGLVRYIWGNGGEGEVEGKNIMIAGLVGIFIMVSVWGIIKLAQNTLGINNSSAPPYPQVPR